MEAVAAHTVILVVFIGHSVHVGLAGHGLVEGGVEHGDHGHILAHDGLAGVDAGDVGGVVQRGKGGAFVKSLHNLGVNLDGGGKLLTAVNDAVTNSVNLLHGGHNAVLGAGKLVDNSRNSLRVSGHGHVLIENGLAADERGVLEMAVYANTLAEAFCKDSLSVHVKKLILQRGAAGVDNKNFH